MRVAMSILFLIAACDPCAGSRELATYPGEFRRIADIPSEAWSMPLEGDTGMADSVWSCTQSGCGDGLRVECALVNGSPHYDEWWQLEYDSAGELTYAHDGGCGNHWGTATCG